MTKTETIQKAIDYIEENLRSEITFEDLIGETHFSQSYFMYLFQEAVGLPCMKYINRRRLLWALFEMNAGKKGIDAALEYGYDTYAGFFKAFRQEFGCSPSTYRKRYTIGKPHRLNLQQEGHFMISNQKLKTILAHWDGEFENIRAVKYSNGIIADSMWVVTLKGERYILSACTNEVSLKRCLEPSRLEETEGLAAAAVFKTRDDLDYVTDGDLCFYLTKKRRVIGEMASPLEFYRIPENAQAVGQILARLHRCLRNASLNEFYEETDRLETVLNRLPKVRQALSLPEAFYLEYEDWTKRLAPKLPKQLIHRDPNESNIIMENGKCTGFLHFELSRVGYRIFDLCYAATAVLCGLYMQNEDKKAPADGIWFPIYHNIILGYESLEPLTREEHQSLPYMVYTIQIICVSYFNNYDKFERMARANEKMLLWLWENREAFPDSQSRRTDE